jgi:hypothetical protein
MAQGMIPWTVLLPIWIVPGALLLCLWLYLRRKRHPSQPPDPDIVLAGRKLYEDGEFQREIVRLIPRRLFEDEVTLSCGHQATRLRDDPETHVNCYQCAQEWIDREGKKL